MKIASWMSRGRRAAWAVLAALALVVGAPAAASAATHQNAYYYSHWNFGSTAGLWNVDQQMRVEKKAPSTYWAMTWTWSGAQQGGYMGLQTNGDRFDQSTGDTAIFSLWNANASSGPSCGKFSGEGTGLSCRLAFPITPNRMYRLRVWRLNADSGGQWWGAWVQDLTSGKDTFIGQLRVAGNASTIGHVENFVEYFGSAVACNAVPTSRALWTQPAGNSRGGSVYDVGSTYTETSTDKGACVNGTATLVATAGTKGVRVAFGG